MIVSRTPYRISLFGGGTDYPEWYRAHGGAVIGTTIGRYCYISARFLPPFYGHTSRIVYSVTEVVRSNAEIQHPAVRGVLAYLGIDRGVEIHHHGDLPARSGIGSSSAFTVGLLHVLSALEGRQPDPGTLARQAITVEHDILREHVGCQDQVLAAIGGFLRIDFPRSGEPNARPLSLSADRRAALGAHLLLFFTGVSRTASDIAAEQIARLHLLTAPLNELGALVDQAQAVLESRADLADVGPLLHESWRIKRSLSALVSNAHIDDLYERARAAGATGGKIVGAGGGGFLLLFAAPDRQTAVRAALAGLLEVPVTFDSSGSQIVVNDGPSA